MARPMARLPARNSRPRPVKARPPAGWFTVIAMAFVPARGTLWPHNKGFPGNKSPEVPAIQHSRGAAAFPPACAEVRTSGTALRPKRGYTQPFKARTQVPVSFKARRRAS